MQIGALSGIFLALSAIDHLLTVLPGINGWYHRKLLRNQNPLRWIEYACAPPASGALPTRKTAACLVAVVALPRPVAVLCLALCHVGIAVASSAQLWVMVFCL